jgi:hypothetical protein
MLPPKMKLSFDGKSKSKIKKRIFCLYALRMHGAAKWLKGFFRKYAPEGYEPMSAGTIPKSQIPNPKSTLLLQRQ